MKFRLSSEAINDLELIWLYTFEEWSVSQADRYIDLLMDEVAFISQNPRCGTDYSEIRKGYFKVQAQSHLIFYKINKRQGMIDVIRILHQSMDVDSRLEK